MERRRPEGEISWESTLDRERAFRAIFDAHAPRIRRFLRSRVASTEDAEDVLVETFWICWQHLNRSPGTQIQQAWLFGVATRVLANQRRGDDRRRRLLSALATASPAEDQREVDERFALLEEALSELDDDERRILRLSVWLGLPRAALARELGCSLNAVSIRLHRARRSLRDHYLLLRGATRS